MARLLRSATPQSIIRKPVVVDPAVVSPPLQLRLARARPPRLVLYRLWPPVLTPVIVTASALPLAIRLARAPRVRAVTSELRPPTVVGPTVTFTGRPLAIKLALQLPRRPVSFKLRPPATVGPAVAFRPPQLKLVRTPRQAFKVGSWLKPPAVTGAVVVTAPFAPIQVRLTRALRPRPVAYKLRAPTVVSAPVVSPPLMIRLAPSGRQGRRSSYQLRPPAVLLAILPTPLRIMLAKARRQPPTMSRLRRPTVIATAVVSPPLRVLKAVPVPRLARNVLSKLRPPSVVQLFPFITGRFDRTTPAGATGDLAGESNFNVNPSGRTGGAAGETGFDAPAPKGQ